MLSEIRDLRPGMLIRNTYRIVRKLGQGGMGAVYLAEQVFMEEPRALKFLSGELSQDADFTARFRREVRTLRQARHKNVVDSGDLEPAEDGTLFFSMEFIDGPDLRSFIRSAPQPFDVQLALSIARGIADGLGAAHAKGMVHRDIKPENILMACDGDGWIPKIADFGIVATRELSRYTMTGSLLLTPFYAAPEQWRGSRAAELDGRTDFYALGGVLYEMLTGEKPFDAEDYHGWAQQHMNAAPRPPSSLRPDLANWKGLDALVLRLLAKDREQRPKDSAELLSLIDMVAYAPPRTRTARERLLDTRKAGKVRTARRVPKWMWATAATLLALAAVPAVLFFTPKLAVQWGDALVGGAYWRQPSGLQFGYRLIYRLACAGGNGDACSFLANYYATRFGVRDSKAIAVFSKAVALYSKECDAGNSKACIFVGRAYDSGYGVGQDYARAVAPYTKACDAGIADACENLGILYFAGHGVAIDHSRAIALYTKACDSGNSEGCLHLGEVYLFGLPGGSPYGQDPEAEMKILSKACDMGNAKGCLDAGLEAYQQLGDSNKSKQLYSRAIALYTKACDSGNSEGCLTLGQVYTRGLPGGLPDGQVDHWEAGRNILLKACNMGNAEGCSEAGIH